MAVSNRTDLGSAVRNAGALARYSPSAFMYSSKLSLEIIFQYPFRSTGMLAVSLLPGRPVNQDACCSRWTVAEYRKRSTNASI